MYEHVYEHLNNFDLKSQLDYIKIIMRHTKMHLALYLWSIYTSVLFSKDSF